MSCSKHIRCLLAVTLTLNLTVLHAQKQLPNQDLMVRIAEIQIHPEYLDEYRNIPKDETAASMDKEPGVIAIFPMFVKDQPLKNRTFPAL